MKAATPQGEVPSDGSWCVVLLLSHGEDLKKNLSEVSTEDNQRTMSISSSGVADSIHPSCSSATSSTSLQEK